MIGPDELRPLSAGRLLSIRQRMRSETDDPLEQAAYCNAAVLADCCFRDGMPLFQDVQAVLDALTFREMEELLTLLDSGGQPSTNSSTAFQQRQETTAVSGNPNFDEARFQQLLEGAL